MSLRSQSPRNHKLFFISVILFLPVNKFIRTPFLDSTYKLWYHIVFALPCLTYFTSVWQSRDQFMLLRMALFCLFLWLGNSPWYICTTSSLPSPPLMDVWPASMSWLLLTVLQWTLGCMYHFQLWFSLHICPELGLQDDMVALFLVFKGTSILSSILAATIYLTVVPPTV